MEMIAMLNGLGRTPGPAYKYAPRIANPYWNAVQYRLNGFGAAIPDATYDQIVAFLAAAKTDADFKDVLASIEASSKLSEAQKADLKQKVADAQKPFYKKPLYWVGIAAVAYVGYRLYKGQPIIPSFSGLGAMKKSGEKHWMFNWVGGGYNTVFAKTKAEALRKARAMGKPNVSRGGGMTVTLVPDAKSFRAYSSRDPDTRSWLYD